jgi:two-component system nitrate/nitrite response regulator NarL
MHTIPSAPRQPARSSPPLATPSKPTHHGDTRPIRVLLADDHPVVRRGLSSCLSRHEHLRIVGEAADGREALSQARGLSPDIILMDIDMPHMNGLTATDMLRKELPHVRVLILSFHSQTDDVVRTVQSGARGYVLKNAPTEELAKAIETVHAGQGYFTPDLARVAARQFVRGTGEGPQVSHLSGREREVLIAIAEGLSNKEIACRLNLGVRTIDTHRERLMRKLNIHSAAGLTRFAISKGLVTLAEDPQDAAHATP